MIPANMIINMSLIYEQHENWTTYTHQQLSAYTHEQLRNGVDDNGK
jgi:hypothetical protein